MTPWVEYEKIRNKSFFTDRNPLCALFNHGRSFSTAMILIITLSWGIYYSYLYGISQFCNFSVLYGFVYVHICTRTANHETISLLSYRLLSWHAWWNISLVEVAVTSSEICCQSLLLLPSISSSEMKYFTILLRTRTGWPSESESGCCLLKLD